LVDNVLEISTSLLYFWRIFLLSSV